MKFRKKPVVIEAHRFDECHTHKGTSVPGWFVKAVLDGVIVAEPPSLVIITLEGSMRASYGDWVIKGVKGELYPCKPDIFEATYEKVE